MERHARPSVRKLLYTELDYRKRGEVQCHFAKPFWACFHYKAVSCSKVAFKISDLAMSSFCALLRVRTAYVTEMSCDEKHHFSSVLPNLFQLAIHIY